MKKLENKTDKELAVMIQGGSEAAFAKLYHKHYQGILYKMKEYAKGDVALAQDLALEVFAKAYEKIKSYTTDYAFSTWLYKIAFNHFVDYDRTVKLEVLSLDGLSKEDTEGNEMGFQLESSNLNPEQEMIAQESHDIIANFINEIPREKIREIARLRFFDELQYVEIVERTGMPLGSVQANIFRIRKDLEHKMKKATPSKFRELELA